EPIIVILFIVMIVYGLKRDRLDAITNIVGVSGVLFVVSNQIQINCGMQYIMRYNVWIEPILIFYVILKWNVIYKNSEQLYCYIGGVQAIYTLSIIIYLIIGTGAYSPAEFAPWTKIIMNNFPYLYNPTHGIFYSRALGSECYYSSLPVIYSDSNGYIHKILLSEEAEEIFYSDEWQLYNCEGEKIDKTKLNTITVDEGDYKYVNIKGKVKRIDDYELINEISLCSDEYNGNEYSIIGLSEPEDWGAWTDGNEMVIRMNVEEHNYDEYKLHMYINRVFYPPQELTILINDELVYSSTIEGEKNIYIACERPQTDEIVMKIKLPDAISPNETIGSNDFRKLGIGISEIFFWGRNE
nr:hypothetical protein [Butyrivibrio sp.]